MKLVYHVKFRANFGLFKAALGTVYGETKLEGTLPEVAITALESWFVNNGSDFITLVNERGVYIALNLE